VVKVSEHSRLDRRNQGKTVTTSSERALAMVEEQVLKEDENAVPPAPVRHYGSTHSRFGGKSASPSEANGAVL